MVQGPLKEENKKEDNTTDEQHNYKDTKQTDDERHGEETDGDDTHTKKRHKKGSAQESCPYPKRRDQHCLGPAKRRKDIRGYIAPTEDGHRS